MISDLCLVNFRSYHDQSFGFYPLTVIVAPNGVGKTNIIEALFFLSTGRSFRTVHDRELVRFQQPYARISSGNLDVSLVDGVRVKKQLRIDGKALRLLEILGVQPTVLFTPVSMGLIDGSPSVRRQFIDILLSQTNPLYARALLEYQRALKQRNAILHQIQSGETGVESLNLWDDLLVKSSVPVLQARHEMAHEINSQLNAHFHIVSPHKDEVVESVYESSVEKRERVEGTEALEKLFRERLHERRVAEVQAGRSLIGPHRDDIHFLLNQKPVALYGSRGQARTLVVALKLFEYHYIQEHSGKAPTLLLDDVFSEFDTERRKRVLKVLPNAQMIFTATDLDHVGKLPSHAKVIDLGQIVKKSAKE